MKLEAIISARRAYEFGVDEIKLSALTHSDVIEAIRERFRFEAAEIGSPPDLFGPAIPTTPPGLVFAGGIVEIQEQPRTTVRMISIDARKIVVDVVGASQAIDVVYGELQVLLRHLEREIGIAMPSSSPSIFDYSEITLRSSTILEASFPSKLGASIRSAFLRKQPELTVDYIPSVRMRPLLRGLEYGGTQPGDPASFVLDLRAGSKYASGLVYSGAPLTTDEHLDYLEGYERSLLA